MYDPKMYDSNDLYPSRGTRCDGTGRDERRLPCSPLGLLLCALLAAVPLLASCGGGGAPPPAADEEVFIAGLAGSIMLPDFDLGRVIEQEPNDSARQAFDLAPLWPRSTLEVSGTLGTTAARYGRVDGMDVLRIQSCVDQRLSLELLFEADDPLGSEANVVGATVFETETDFEIGSLAGAAQPLTLAFDATAYVSYDVHVSIAAGHAWYTLRLEGSEASQPAPLLIPPVVGSSPEAPSHTKPHSKSEASCAGSHLLVRFAEGCDPSEFCEEQGYRLGRRTATGSYLVHFGCDGGPGPTAPLAMSKALQSSPLVKWAEPDWHVQAQSLPDDPLFNRQWNLPLVGAPSAWDITTGDASIVVGIIDSGIIDHPDLEGQFVPGYDFISDPAISGDGDGRDPDPTDTGDLGDGSGLSVWHGTHVAGIIAARQDNALGGSGVAPGVRLMMLRALGISGGLVSDVVDAVLYAAGLHTTAQGHELEEPLSILNLSVGLPQDAPDLRDACERAANNGVLLVGAVGNTGGGVLYPAAYPSVLAVAAVDGSAATTAYSNFGDEVDIAAPGGGIGSDDWNDGWPDGILSTLRDETVDRAVYSHGYVVGTSQAAPHVSGAAALLLSVDPTLSALQLKSILTGTALDLGATGDDGAYGAGLLRVHEAVKSALLRLSTPREDAPYLMLPTTSCQFEDFGEVTIRREIPLFNGGGGRLEVVTAIPVTDSGVTWLDASLTRSRGPGDPVSHSEVVITVNRNVAGAHLPGRYSGTILLAGIGEIFGAIQVVMYVDEQTRAGRDLSLVTLEQSSGIVRSKSFATADRGYRYWLRGLPASEYKLQAGEDLDANGFFCESFEACGWFGGATEEEATPVPFAADVPALQGLSIDLIPQPRR